VWIATSAPDLHWIFSCPMHTFIPYPADRAGVSLDNISPGAHHSAGGEV
jgi:hypothetical protein